MGYYLENGWHYWEGDPRPEAKNVIEVPRRPSPDHQWNGTAWEIPPEIAVLRRQEAADCDLNAAYKLIQVLKALDDVIQDLLTATGIEAPMSYQMVRSKVAELIQEHNL